MCVTPGVIDSAGCSACKVLAELPTLHRGGMEEAIARTPLGQYPSPLLLLEIQV